MGEQDDIRSLLEDAGQIALKYFRNVTARRKASFGLVTEADLAIQSFIVRWLERRYPDHGIIAEEADCRIISERSGRYWTVDPIDGTSSFVAGLSVWGIGLGEGDASGPLAGYFYMPVTRDYFCRSPEGDVLLNGKSVSMKRPAALHGESLLLSISRLHRHHVLAGTYPGKVRSLGSTIAHACYVAAGMADAALLGRVWIWDILPGVGPRSQCRRDLKIYPWSGGMHGGFVPRFQSPRTDAVRPSGIRTKLREAPGGSVPIVSG